jgi:Fe-S-cluster-containing hydrogenase component 2
MEDGWATVIQESCFGCGVCADKCEQGAVQINLDPTKGEPLEILSLMEEVRHVV